MAASFSLNDGTASSSTASARSTQDSSHSDASVSDSGMTAPNLPTDDSAENVEVSQVDQAMNVRS